jgi:D-alanyl-D-alanine dipeptidase
VKAAAFSLGLLALVACSDRKSAAPPAAIGGAKPPPAGSATPTDKAHFLITAVVDDWTSTKANMIVWERDKDGWKKATSNWPAVIGRSGAAWGIGVHGEAPPREGPIKKEGDGKAPAGVFAIRGLYGLDESTPSGVKLPYESTAKGDWLCIDDPNSEHYDEIVDRKVVASDWESAEELLRDDDLYTYVVDVAHNPKRLHGKGSCIFLHVWGGPDSTTSGCTAMDKVKLQRLLETIDTNTLYVLLPKADYEALAPSWGLPPQ